MASARVKWCRSAAPSTSLMPRFGGPIDHHAWREERWARFNTAGTRRLKQCVERYSGAKRASWRLPTAWHSPTSRSEFAQPDASANARMGRKAIHSTVLTTDEEAMAVALRRYMLLPLNACRSALKASISHLTRFALHRCRQRRDIRRLPDMTGTSRPRVSSKRT